MQYALSIRPEQNSQINPSAGFAALTSKITVWRGCEQGAGKQQAMQSGTHFAKAGGVRSRGPCLLHACCRGASLIRAEHKTCVLNRWINPSAARFCKSPVDENFEFLLQKPRLSRYVIAYDEVVFGHAKQIWSLYHENYSDPV